MITETSAPSRSEIAKAASSAAKAIPPAFPLSSTVAVNPFLGQSSQNLAEVAARLGKVAGCAVTSPRDQIAKKIAKGAIEPVDIAGAVASAGKSWSVAKVVEAASSPRPRPVPLSPMADLAAGEDGRAWQAHPDARIGFWAASYFDQGQAMWSGQNALGAYADWHHFAAHDATPELAGLLGLRGWFAAQPRDAEAALEGAIRQLGLSSDALSLYFHRLLMGLGGWAQVARYRLWQADLAGHSDTTLTDLLAIRVVWEAALLAQRPDLDGAWHEAREKFAEPVIPEEEDIMDAVLQEAAERASQRALAGAFAPSVPADKALRPTLQAAFCIDVRSEVMRRALEAQSSEIATLGFAGFFGLTVAHTPAGACEAEARLPVLLNPGLASRDAGDHGPVRIAARATRAWGRFRQAAVSSFAFVEAAGPLYAGKLVREALGHGHAAPGTAKPVFDPPLPQEAQIDAAETILNAMSLRDGFATVVMIAGHGAHVTNNPHASALQCGACGGYGGDVNARLLADTLNQPFVRAGLRQRGIEIPEDTVFVAALHDTATDSIALYRDDLYAEQAAIAAEALEKAELWCTAAARLARSERAACLPGVNAAESIVRRARNWAETRPEWGLAGCRGFVIAPRDRTLNADLKGQVFLHSYDWRQDDEFKVLELILTAPVVVASWISLQYYGSVVAPEVFGAGTKQVHNVSGGMGVQDGATGMLRTGLSLQSVHDGGAFVHDPLRLSVVVDAPAEAITDILARHSEVRALFDNGWLKLLRLGPDGVVADRYVGDLEWEPFAPTRPVAMAAR